MLEIVTPDFRAIAPELVLVATAFAIITWEMLTRTRRHGVSVAIALAGTLSAAWALASGWGLTVSTFGGAVVMDPFSSFFKAIFLAALFFTVCLSLRYVADEGVGEHAEYYTLLTMATVGMMVMASGRELVTIFLGLELLAMSLYILAGYFKRDPRSNESALKYFILGSFSTGIMLFGMSYIYGVTGSTHLREIALTIAGHPGMEANKALLLGMMCAVTGLAFKISVVPFHQWTPDVYEGAPTSVTAFMSVGAKAAGFAALLQLLLTALPALRQHWEPLFVIFAVLTMTVGNLAALGQESVKRMLAYSSVAHVGYILIGLVAAHQLRGTQALSAVLFYLAAYTFMNMGAFALIIFLRHQGAEGEKLRDFYGLARRSPLAALAMMLFLFSLAGIPPTAGFAAKLGIFYGAVQGGYYTLAVLGVLNSVVAAYYYLKVVVVMYMYEPASEERYRCSTPLLWLGVVVSLAGTLLLGLFPARVMEAARLAVAGLG